jgi:hypothetical protein
MSCTINTPLSSFLTNLIIDPYKIPITAEFNKTFKQLINVNLCRHIAASQISNNTQQIKMCNDIASKFDENDEDVYLKVKYYQKAMGDLSIGRYYETWDKAEDGSKIVSGIVSLCRPIKHTLLEYSGYIDLDIVSCHISILVSICENSSVDCKHIKNYLLNRDEIINTLINYYSESLTKSDIKEFFTSILYGRSFKKWIGDCGVEFKRIDKHIIIKEFMEECATINKNIISSNEVLYNLIKDDKKSDYENNGTFMSYYFQIIENYILYQTFLYLKENNIIKGHNVCLEYDGMFVPPPAKELFDKNITLLDTLNSHLQSISGLKYIRVQTKNCGEANLELIKLKQTQPLILEETYVPDSANIEMIKNIIEDSKRKKQNAKPINITITNLDIECFKRGTEARLVESFIRHAVNDIIKYHGSIYIYDESKILWIKDKEKYLQNTYISQRLSLIGQKIQELRTQNKEVKELITDKQMDKTMKYVESTKCSVLYSKIINKLNTSERPINTNHDWIPVPDNKVINILTHEIRQRQKEHYFSFELPTSPIIEALNDIDHYRLKNINKMFRDVSTDTYGNARPDLERFHRAYIGRCLKGTNTKRKNRICVLCIAPGANGKTTLYEMLVEAILGESELCGPASDGLFFCTNIPDGNATNDALLAIKDYFWIYCSEPHQKNINDKIKFNESLLKKIIDRSYFTARPVFGAHSKFKCNGVYSAMMNGGVLLSNNMAGKVLIPPFDTIFNTTDEEINEINNDFIDSVMSDKEAILTYLMIGLKDYVENGLPRVRCIEENTAYQLSMGTVHDLIANESDVTEFSRLYIYEKEGSELSIQKIYEEFNKYYRKTKLSSSNMTSLSFARHFSYYIKKYNVNCVHEVKKYSVYIGLDIFSDDSVMSVTDIDNMSMSLSIQGSISLED